MQQQQQQQQQQQKQQEQQQKPEQQQPEQPLKHAQFLMESIPVTERSNPVTASIDARITTDMVLMFCKADQEIFNETYEGLLNSRIVEKLDRLAVTVANLINNNNQRCGIILSGCGTSGRLAFMSSTKFNRLLRSGLGRGELFQYLIAGNDKALFTSQELIEDNPEIGRQQLEQAAEGLDRVIYIGITCGLSAAYIAGQLDLCLQQPSKYTPVLIGFNPVELARNEPVENWNKTFRDVIHEMIEAEREEVAFILNPIIGPEPITGSTRMKSGSATKILLDSLFTSAFYQSLFNKPLPVRRCLEDFRVTQEEAYQSFNFLVDLIDLAGSALNRGGRIFYISENTPLGLVALIDASECTPTFGCDDEDVSGFIADGYKALAVKDRISSDFKQIDVKYFENQILPSSTEKDLIIFLTRDGQLGRIEELAEKSSAQKILIHFCTIFEKQVDKSCLKRESLKFSSVQQLQLPSRPSVEFSVQPLLQIEKQQHASAAAVAILLERLWEETLLELLCKMTCNMLTTGAFIQYGKVYDNYMIDLKIRNDKLFHRAIRIVQKFGECCNEDEAKLYLLRSIYDIDELSSAIQQSTISQHIIEATNKKKVVPCAIFMARSGCSVSEARAQLQLLHGIKVAIKLSKHWTGLLELP